MDLRHASAKLFLFAIALVIAITPRPATAAAIDGMARVPGGEFWMGCGNEATGIDDCRPRHRVHVDAFWMDETPVTNREFEAFTRATSYVTVAERPIDPKEVPGLSPLELAPGSIVFEMTKKPVPLTDHARWWSFVRGANWRHPDGPASDLSARGSHPVTHIAWEDAEAYCRWKSARLPTEAEFERAARGGLDRKNYPWGNVFRPGGKLMANTWQGRFPFQNSREDGFVRTSPVKTFPANGFGLYDVAGNVWQWTADWYRPDEFKKRALSRHAIRNPRGPAESLDPEEPGVAKRMQKGGSFLCSKQFCQRYLVGTRGRAEPKSGASHIGFRCVRNFNNVVPTASFSSQEKKEAHENAHHESALPDLRHPRPAHGSPPDPRGASRPSSARR